MKPRVAMLLFAAVLLAPLGASPTGGAESSSVTLWQHPYARVLGAHGDLVLASEWELVVHEPDGPVPTRCRVVLLEPSVSTRSELAVHEGRACLDLAGSVHSGRVAYPASDGLRVHDRHAGWTVLVGAGLTHPVLSADRLATHDAERGFAQARSIGGSLLFERPGFPLGAEGSLLAYAQPPGGAFVTVALLNWTSGAEHFLSGAPSPVIASLAQTRLAYAGTASPLHAGSSLRLATAAGAVTPVGHESLRYASVAFDGDRILASRFTTREAVLVNANGTAKNLGLGEAVGFAGPHGAWIDRDAGPGVRLVRALFQGDLSFAPPASDLVPLASALPDGWRKGPLPLALDTQAGSAAVEGVNLWIRGTSSVAGPFLVRGDTYSVFADGSVTVTAWAVDAQGNEEVPRDHVFRIDSTPPAISLSHAPLAFLIEGWYRDTLTISVLPSDSGSGIDEYAQRANGGPWQQGFLELADEGLYVVEAYATDGVGHRTDLARHYGVDRTPPVTYPNVTGPRHASGWFTNPASVTFTIDDALSGPRHTRAKITGTSFTSVVPGDTYGTGFREGRLILEWFGLDKANNAEATRSMPINIDLNPPVVTLLSPAPGSVWFDGFEVASVGGANAVASGSVTVRASATDAASGVERIEYHVDGIVRASGSTWVWDTSQETPGLHRLEAFAYDLVGRVSTAKRVDVYVLPAVPV